MNHIINPDSVIVGIIVFIVVLVIGHRAPGAPKIRLRLII